MDAQARSWCYERRRYLTFRSLLTFFCPPNSVFDELRTAGDATSVPKMLHSTSALDSAPLVPLGQIGQQGVVVVGYDVLRLKPSSNAIGIQHRRQLLLREILHACSAFRMLAFNCRLASNHIRRELGRNACRFLPEPRQALAALTNHYAGGGRLVRVAGHVLRSPVPRLRVGGTWMWVKPGWLGNAGCSS